MPKKVYAIYEWLYPEWTFSDYKGINLISITNIFAKTIYWF